MAATNLKGKIVFITGASSGIGKACAHAFAAEGAKLLLAARREDRLKAEVEELRSVGAESVHTAALDVTSRASVEAFVSGLPSEWETIDVLINNAGLSRGMEKLYEGKPDDWEEMIYTNVMGLLYVTRAVAPGHGQARQRPHSGSWFNRRRVDLSRGRCVLREQGSSEGGQ